MYYYVCHTCEEEDYFRDRESAQVVFNEHVEGQHEVVLERVESPGDGPVSGRGERPPLAGPTDGQTETAERSSND